MKQWILAAACCCGLTVTALAQHSLSGRVFAGENKDPLPGAAIAIKESGKTEVSDVEGKFRFNGLAAGRYKLSVSFLGYAPFEIAVDVDGDVSQDIFLQETFVLTDEVIIAAVRASESTPTTYSNIGKETIARQNYGQDLPFLLNWTPSLVTTSDAGTGFGYTGLRIRGSDATHINVTINGIPYNDSESQSVYWVDVPDIASSTQSIQVQRGVGTSTNGAGAFGGSVNVQTSSLEKEPFAEINNSYGSFNTHKHTLKAGTGLINKVWAFEGRISKIKSDGYIERAKADLDSYYLSGGYYGKRTLIKAIVFGGHELTYQSWYGIDPDMMKINRKFNYAGAIYDGGNIRYYDRQVDDYRQDHYQLHFAQELAARWNVNAAVHYTYGRGYYEEYLQDQSYAGLGLANVIIGSDTLRTSDFVRRQWLDNRFYGATWSIHHTGERVDLTLGGAVNRYGNAKHFGEIIWAKVAGPTQLRDHYYEAVSEKNDFTIYGKLNYALTNRWNAFLDLQYRRVGYRSAGQDDSVNPYSIADQFDFINPKAGLNFAMSDHDVLYASYAIAHREPTRADYLGGIEKPRSEELGNLEAGWRRKSSRYTLEANYYWMDYHNQLVLTGQLNSTGYPIRANVGRSYRTGIELSGTIKVTGKLSWTANATWSKNKNKELVVVNNESIPVTYRNTNIILSPTWIAGSQWAWSPVKGLEAALLSKYVGDQYLDNTQLEAVKLNSYFVNDIRLSYTISPSFVKAIEFGLLFNNVFNTLYSSNGAVYGGVPYYYPQAGRNYLARMTVRF